MSNNQIDSIRGFEKLKNLKRLYLISNQLNSIQGVEKLENFYYVTIDLRFNNLFDTDKIAILNNKTKFLFLMNNRFQKILSNSFLNLDGIESINLDNNQIQHVEPMAFYSLNNLTYLSLNNNSIKVIYDFMFSHFIQLHLISNNVSFIFETSLKEVSSVYLDYSSLVYFKHLKLSYFCSRFLYLGNQKIENLIENTLKGLYSTIDLSFNLLTSSSFETHSFGYLPNLNEISFANNLIEYLDFSEAFQFNMTSLKLLDFEKNKISSIQRGFFAKFPNLNVLLLSSNNFNLLKKDYFANLEMLKYLNLSNNQILTIEDKTFEYLGSLVYLNLSANLIYDLSQSLFTKLSKLEILILSENKLESIQKNFFDGLYRLKYLDLAQNQIKFLNKDSFFAIIDLENLYLKSNLINNLNGSLCILKNLTILDLSFNELESFKKEDVISNLTFLDLSLNPLKLLESNQKNLYGLKSLKLSSTNSSLISNINFELFTQLEELDLSDNLNINTTQINKLLRLRKLNLRNTNSTDCTFFKNLNGIEELDAGNNKQYYSCLRYLKFSFKSTEIFIF